MKLNKNQLIIIGFVAAILSGLGLGYLAFSPDTNPQETVVLDHVHEVGEESIWTCSMHPQIRQNEPGDCPICGMDLIPLDQNSSTDPTILEMTPEAVKLAQIETTKIGLSGTTEKRLFLSGKIQADERRASSQVAHIPGRIEKLYVSFEGERVKRGQKIANLYSPELITAQEELIQALKLRESNPGLYKASRQKLSLWKLSEDQINSIEQSQKIEETFDIYADASGVVTLRRVSVGDYVKQGGVLFELINLNKVWVLFDAYEEDLSKIKIGDNIRFTTPSVPGNTFDTRISFIDPVINSRTRVASIRGEVVNTSRSLKPEMFVKGELTSLSKESAQLLIPKSSILWTGKRSVVYIKVTGLNIPSFRLQEVELGERLGSNYLVENGLQEGDEVVTYGSFSIDAAAQLNNQQSMMNRLIGNSENQESPIPNYSSLTPATFKEQLTKLVAAYFPLKDALVQSDVEATKSKAKTFLSSLNLVDMKLINGEVHNYWMKQVQILKSHSETISLEEDIEKQRNQFSFLSAGLIETVQALGITGETLYVQHCPMAMDNNGADWLSLQKEIRNPYFGDQMLTCGSISKHLPESVPVPLSNQNPIHNH